MNEPVDLPLVRRDLMRTGITEADMPTEPMDLLVGWLDEAEGYGIHNANAMAVATSDENGVPSVRQVLLRGRTKDGLVFYSNYQSQKGLALAANPRAEVLFSWLALDRQIRCSGGVSKVPSSRSDAYFATRTHESRMSAIASAQSRPIGSRAELEALHAAVGAGLGDGEPARPDHWGGYLLVADRIEFWQGREHRLHDRLVYQRTDDGWSLTRLAP